MAELSSYAPSPSACSYVPSEPSRQVVDPDGDLSLKVGKAACINILPTESHSEHEHELPVVFVVCSRTLARASRVWKTLLFGGFAESKPHCASSASDWVVELPDDDPQAMATILNIIHCRFELLPRTAGIISLKRFYELTVLTDKYNLAHVLRPWAPAWIKATKDKYESLKHDRPTISDLERLSWIAWEMGDQDLYEKVSGDLILHCPVDGDGNLLNYTDCDMVTLYSFNLEPPGQHDHLKKARLCIIKNALEVYGKVINMLLDKSHRGRITCIKSHCVSLKFSSSKTLSSTVSSSKISSYQISECEGSTLGMMIRSLAFTGYWPLPETADIRVSVKTLLSDLKAVKIASPVHPGCLGVIERDVKISSCADTRLLPVPLSLVTRMAEQATKSGIN